MAVLTGKSDSLNLYLKLIDSSVKALSKLLDISERAGCPYILILKSSLDELSLFKDRVLKDLDYKKLSRSA